MKSGRVPTYCNDDARTDSKTLDWSGGGWAEAGGRKPIGIARKRRTDAWQSVGRNGIIANPRSGQVSCNRWVWPSAGKNPAIGNSYGLDRSRHVGLAGCPILRALCEGWDSLKPPYQCSVPVVGQSTPTQSPPCSSSPLRSAESLTMANLQASPRDPA